MHCGLDFGTSNSVISIAYGNDISLIPLENSSAILPSSIFFDYENNQTYFGKEAIAKYVCGTEGRLMSAIKSILGTSLQNDHTFIKSRAISFQDIIALFLTHIKEKAETHLEQVINKVVIGRPVHFSDSNIERDLEAENILREICRSIGFNEIIFQLEPIAALNGLTLKNTKELVVLVVDIGGGTSDFSVILKSAIDNKSSALTNQVLANTGVHVGGTDFDRLLALSQIMPLLGFGTNLVHKNLPFPNHFFVSLSDWSKLNFLYTRKNLIEINSLAQQSADQAKINRLLRVINNRLGHELLLNVEQTKICLSSSKEATVDLSCIEADLKQIVSQKDLKNDTAKLINKIDQAINECLSLANITSDKVEAILFTGGSTLLPTIRQLISDKFPTIGTIEADKFGAVAKGLAYQAGFC